MCPMIIIFNLFLVRAMLRGLFLNFVPMTARSSFTYVIKQLSQLAVCAAWTSNVVCMKSSIFPVYFSSLQFTDVAGFISNEYMRKTSRFFEKKTL